MSGPPRNAEIAAFDQYKAAHPLLTAAHTELLATIREHGDAVMVLLAGPSGVGKSTLLEHVISDLDAEWAPYAPPGTDPIRSFLMPPFGPQGFSLKDLYFAIQRALDEPGIESKVLYQPAGRDQDSSLVRRRTTESAAREATRKALVEREVAVLVGDEAQHLCEAGGTAHIMSLLESIKWLGMATGTLIVLAGTYDLRALIGLNPQLDRRTPVVHFPRYKDDVEAERADFINVLRKLETHLPGGTVGLLDDWKHLYDVSNGCVGSLKMRLLRGLGAALTAGRPLSIADLRPNKFDRRRIARHRSDIRRGEDDFSTDMPDEHPDSAETLMADDLPDAAFGTRSRPRRPFKRTGKRDRTGAIGSDQAADLGAG